MKGRANERMEIQKVLHGKYIIIDDGVRQRLSAVIFARGKHFVTYDGKELNARMREKQGSNRTRMKGKTSKGYMRFYVKRNCV